MYTVDGRLRRSSPGNVHETIDLGGRYVIPPLAEGHNHWVEPARVAEYNACYLADGVFYIRDLANVPMLVRQMRDKVNLPTSVDFTTTLQGFTGPGGHPVEQFDLFVELGMVPKDWKRDYDPQGTFVVQTRAEVDERILILKQEKADMVKVFLLYSEDYGKRLSSPEYFGRRGIDPALVPYIVQAAKRAKLKVAAHTYTANDFRVAVAAGVSDIVHLPGVGFEPELGMEPFKLTAADARAAKRAKIRVNPTVINLDREAASYQALLREVIIPNLRLLLGAGVPILVGSDQFRHSSRVEIDALDKLGIFSDAELLRMATQQTTQAIFPNRKLGRLEDGFEADFLVLDKDPSVDIANLDSIHTRVKQGRRLDVPVAAKNRPGRACIQ